MKHLKNFGFGKKDFEGVISEQAMELVNYLEKNEGRMMMNNSVFSTSAVNLIWSLIGGYSFSREDPEIKGRTQSYLLELKLFHHPRKYDNALYFIYITLTLTPRKCSTT